MAVVSGQRLGPYEILSAVGIGGMGEVYRARDTRLDRTVAIKILPDRLADRPDLRERFEREARTIASLNHPHICVLHDIGHHNGTDYLVMEYVEGDTLAQRLEKGPLPFEQVLLYAIEIADALDKAHRKGITHRDLKPGNIVLSKMGAKLLDFGLAKLRQGTVSATSPVSAFPTAQDPITAEGTILGTLQYMAPEQLEGKDADARTDIFALGAVVYEMATGKKAFEGKSQASVIGKILETDPPPISSLQPMTPPALDRIVKKCLRKDPDERWQDARDVTDELKWINGSGSQPAVPVTPVVRRKLDRLAWAVAAAALVIAAAAASVAYLRRATAVIPPVRFAVGPPEKGSFSPLSPFLTLSPDGSNLAFVASGPTGTRQLWIRALDSLAAQPLPGSEMADVSFWSADSRSVAFYAEGSLKKMAVSGGPAQTLTAAIPLPIGGGTWSQEGVVLFGTFPPSKSGIQRVSAAGGTATPATTLDASRQENAHLWPHFLPDGRHFLYLARSTNAENNGIYVGSLDSQERTLLLNANSNAVYVPPGYLLYHRAGTLMAQPFDAQRTRLMGEPVPIAEGLQFVDVFGHAAFAASQNGVLAYRSGTGMPTRTLVWVSRNGTEQPLAAPERAYDYPRLSPDGGRIALEIGPQIWIYDLARDALTRLTFEEGSVSENPIWSPDGKRILFDSSTTPRGIFSQMADGSGGLERLTTSEYQQTTRSWSSDGQWLAFNQLHPTTQRDIWVLRLSDRKAQPFLTTRFNEGAPEFSPDGRWLTYVSDESGGPEIYVQPYPSPGGKWQISTEGGTEPVWNHNGRELFYRSGTRMMVVDVTTQPTFSAGKPRLLFDRQYLSTPFPQTFPRYAVSPDGQRFLMVKQGEQALTQINVVQNWISELKGRGRPGTN
jgi:serine/threonine protein kinase/Tol biopolymer transport system component